MLPETLTLEQGAAHDLQAAPAIEQHTWTLDTENAVFTTSNGFALQLRRPSGITSLVLERVRQQGKPKIPMVEVTIGGKYKQLEANPNDENYKALLEEWAVSSGLRTMQYIYVMGIDMTAPEEYIEAQREFFPDATPTDFKYLYIASLVPDGDIEALTEAIMGMNIPTARGLQDAADSFRDNGKRA